MTTKKLNVCLIGSGRAGMIHARNYQFRIDRAQIVAIVDSVEESAKRAAEELGVDRFYTDYHEILEDESIDAVLIVAPTNLHKQIVVDCANSKKHIFCEKPMAMNTEECDEMIKVCQTNGVKLQIGFMRRFDASFQEAKHLLESGAIGDLVQIHSHTRGPSKPKAWMYDLRKSNGILAEVNSHDIDSIRWFTDSDIDTLYAVAGNYRNPEVRESYPDYYDSVLMTGTTKNGIHFSIDGAAYIQYGYDSMVELIGTEGKIEAGRSDREFVRCTTVQGGTSTPFISSWMTLFAEAYLKEDNSFVNAVLEDLPVQVTGYDGRMAVAVVEAGNCSIAKKEIIEVE